MKSAIEPPRVDWKQLLLQWSIELLGTKLAADLEPPLARPNWLGFDPASEAELVSTEKRLGTTLPPSYRSFLLTSNGWRTTTPFVKRIRPIADIDWFKGENESVIEAYSEAGEVRKGKAYYDYASGYEAAGFLSKHLSSLLQISDDHDGIYLLNPMSVTPDGEWEGWFFANWVPGATRFPSFAHLMLHEFRSFRQLEAVSHTEWEPPEIGIPSASLARSKAKIAKKARKPQVAIEDLMPALEWADEKLRKKAIREFFGKMRGRPFAVRRPDLVGPLSELFERSTDRDVRSCCVAALTELADDGADVPAFLQALTDPDPGVALTGIFSLEYFPNPNALEPLCKFIQSGVNPLFSENAMAALGEMGDPRAVNTLANVLTDTANKFDQSFGSAAIALARCGASGVDVLIAAANHADSRVRHAATVGLDVSEDPRAPALLDRLTKDPDVRVRERASIRMGNPWK